MEMPDSLGQSEFKEMLVRMCARVQEKKDWLSELDSACGDGDHGVSMARGFAAVEEQLPAWELPCPGALLKKTGMTLVSGIGGATGPLLGTFFMEAGKAAGDKAEVDSPILATMFRAGLTGIYNRGKAQLGDKTMVDALEPAVQALESAAASGKSPTVALESALEAARTGAEATANMVARQGKARYLGERALGHPDAGAYSIVTLFEAMVDGTKNSVEGSK